MAGEICFYGILKKFRNRIQSLVPAVISKISSSLYQILEPKQSVEGLSFKIPLPTPPSQKTSGGINLILIC